MKIGIVGPGHCGKDTAARYGMNGGVVSGRLRSGWDLMNALTHPVAHKKTRKASIQPAQ